MEKDLLQKISLVLEVDYLSYRLHLENLRTAMQLGIL